MKKNTQYIDLAQSSNQKVKDKAVKHLKSKAIHTKVVEDKSFPSGSVGKKVPSGEVSLVTIPKGIRRKMQQSSSTVIPDRFVKVQHARIEGLTEINNGGNKAKPLNQGEYKPVRVNTPKQLRQQQKKG